MSNHAQTIANIALERIVADKIHRLSCKQI